MQQIQQLLSYDHARVLVLTHTLWSAKSVMKKIWYHRHNNKDDWRGMVFNSPKLRMRNEAKDSELEIFVVNRIGEAAGLLAGRQFTNIVYSMQIGMQCQLLYLLRPNMRSVDFKGPFSIEPLWNE